MLRSSGSGKNSTFAAHIWNTIPTSIREVETNIAYRWFLHYNLDTPIPHFATISYAFASRFPNELFKEIFSLILEQAVEKRLVDASAIFIDATHIKANANKKKHRKEQAKLFAARIYDERLKQEINADRIAHGKKPLKGKEDITTTKMTTISTTDLTVGYFIRANIR